MSKHPLYLPDETVATAADSFISPAKGIGTFGPYIRLNFVISTLFL